MILSRYERMVARRYLLPEKGEGFIFAAAGFTEVSHPTQRRVVMRIDFQPEQGGAAHG